VPRKTPWSEYQRRHLGHIRRAVHRGLRTADELVRCVACCSAVCMYQSNAKEIRILVYQTKAALGWGLAFQIGSGSHFDNRSPSIHCHVRCLWKHCRITRFTIPMRRGKYGPLYPWAQCSASCRIPHNNPLLKTGREPPVRNGEESSDTSESRSPSGEDKVWIAGDLLL
jgi:hypothetical protein